MHQILPDSLSPLAFKANECGLPLESLTATTIITRPISICDSLLSKLKGCDIFSQLEFKLLLNFLFELLFLNVILNGLYFFILLVAATF